MTAGAWQDADNWCMYYFLGRRFQNRLVHVPAGADGEALPLGPDYYQRAAAAADFDTWRARLRAAKVDYVVSFKPASLELAWMERRPDLFDRIDGAEDWGVYRVRSDS